MKGSPKVKYLKNPFAVFILCLLIIGTVFKLAPFFNNYRLTYSFIDDGYYMMTVARNIALGNGMSIADGTIQTNGIQPLYTFVLSLIYLITAGDKFSTIKLIVILQFIISCLTFFALWKIGSELLSERKDGPKIALFAAALWYVSPITYLNTTNGLETGFYTLLILLPVWMLFSKNAKYNTKFSILIGAVLGIIFWARNDVVFLVMAICLYILYYRIYDSENFSKNIIHVIIIGIVSLLVALPWLIYNKINFGHIIPISGQSEFVSSDTGGNLKHVPAVIVEYFFSFYQIPYYLKINAVTTAICSFLTALLLFSVFKIRRGYSKTFQKYFFITFIFLAALSLFYGLAFGTYWFLSRYLFPAATLAYFFWADGIFKILTHIKIKNVQYIVSSVFVLFMLSISVYNYKHDYQRVFYYLVDWTQNNLNGNEWIGSIQSGTVGYYYDKTINIDGKVNPEALAAIKEDKLLQYIINKKMDYLIDVNSFAEWKNPELINNYDLIVNDPIKQIAVFKRKAIR